MSAASASRTLTYADYLDLERKTETRHEFLRGDAWAMARGTPLHSRIKSNLLGELHAALRGKPCLEFDADLTSYVEATGLATYSDASVICGPLLTASVDRDAAINPTVIAEVISPSTEQWDTGMKLRHYMRIPTLREVIFIWPSDRRIEHHVRNADDSWTLHVLAATAEIRLTTIEAVVTQAALFDRTEGLEA